MLLATARVLVTDQFGTLHAVRALMDPGSETSLITESLAQRLRLPRTPASVAIYGVGGLRSGVSRGRIAMNLTSRNGNAVFAISALVMPRLSIYGGSVEANSSGWSHIRGLDLADPDFSSTDPVELLLGVDVYAKVARSGMRLGGDEEPIAQQTALGWIIMGPVSTCQVTTALTSLQCSAVDDLNALVRRFWELEEPPRATLPLSPGDAACEEHCLRSHSRDASGRYVVRLATRSALPDLRDTRLTALRVLQANEHRFRREVALRDAYSQFMTEYLELGHMTPASSLPADCSRACYLPHHGVWKGGGEEARIRVVFNGSSRTSSLNGELLAGPNLLPTLCDVIMRWRKHQFVLAADIEKIYRQIWVHPEDRDPQRIYWRIGSRVQEFHLNTVTYGLASAPYLAVRTLRQLAEDEGERFPRAAEALPRDTYVDDVLSGASSQLETCELREQLTQLYLAGGFRLRKWVANHEDLLRDIPAEHRSSLPSTVALTSEEHDVLGIRWLPAEDSFAPTVKSMTEELVTKRTVLRQTARLFDPLGWLAPVVINAKLLIQAAWLRRLDWDAPLAAEDVECWRRLRTELPVLEEIRIPRWSRADSLGALIEMHGFADASERAYGAVLYLRTIADGRAWLTLLIAKTRVAPLRQVSLPRLELCAAALLARIAAHTASVLALDGAAIHLWTDSTVVLGWLQGHPTRWTTFVANRVAEVQGTLPDAHWHHVPGRINPADCASRGMSPLELRAHELWWRGSQYLWASSAAWLAETAVALSRGLPEQRAARVHIACEGQEPEELTRFSSLRRLLRVTAWMRRWLTLATSRADLTRGAVLSATELTDARAMWIRCAQRIAFRDEIKALSRGRIGRSRGPLRLLSPFLDDRGLLRVGGRLKHALLSVDQRHPIILPQGSHLTYLVVADEHDRVLHGGTQLTLASLRRRYWVLRGRQLVKHYIHRCLPCLRWRAANPQPRMGSLPRARVVPSRPFTHTGLDYAGPILLRTTKGRGHRAYKAFVAVFVCFSSQAVHLEVVSDYTADAFLAAFRRFVSRRGLCLHLYSDYGTNFVGADRQLRGLLGMASESSRSIVGKLAEEGVEWHFNPPAAPHFGGLWEAAVKAFKYHLRRVIGESTLTYEEMATFLAEVEACLNSRPLQALSDDVDELDVLTPGHFLVGAPLKAIPEPALTGISPSKLTRWKLLQQMRDHLWQRWSQYLQTLTPRPRWWRAEGGLKEGQLCLLKQETTPPTRWPLVCVTRLHPGDDGEVRVVTVRGVTGELRRPVIKLVPLPTDEESTQRHA
ncbi:uncharacterized protein LOC105197317 [Solenopsis invicta]|uniref:uncharacterized protein LOC105197317 n=1 Tax=Solenopsis invicta TaxID=13686 RepID=UPI00193E67F9|nr:uncharacterized protein LOC105197317 [Solenopsis invicta]